MVIPNENYTNISKDWEFWISSDIVPNLPLKYAHETHERQSLPEYGLMNWSDFFNPRQLLTLVTYVEIIKEAKALIQAEYAWDKAEAIASYLGFVFDRCADYNSRLSGWNAGRSGGDRASKVHALNLNWSYPELNGAKALWLFCAESVSSEYIGLCSLFGTKAGSIGIPGIEQHDPKTIQIEAASADNLTHIPDNSVDAVITDPPYYATIQYAELSDFFYVWLKRTLGDIFPELFYLELTDKDCESVANPSRFRNMEYPPKNSPTKIMKQKWQWPSPNITEFYATTA